MTTTRIFTLVCAVLSVVFLFACNENSSPVSTLNTGGSPQGRGSQTFVFALGDEFVYQQFSIDSTGTKTPTSELHEYFASTLSIHGKSNVFLVIDSTFTTGALASIDTAYYYTDGTSVAVYGLIASYMTSSLNMFSNLFGTGSIFTTTPKWDVIIDAGNHFGWTIDTSISSLTLDSIPVLGQITIPITVDLNGTDIGDTTITTNETSLTCDQSYGTGSLNFNFNALILSYTGSAPLNSHYYMAYSPTCISKATNLPTLLSITSSGTTTPYQIPGSERDLISWSKN